MWVKEIKEMFRTVNEYWIHKNRWRYQLILFIRSWVSFSFLLITMFFIWMDTKTKQNKTSITFVSIRTTCKFHKLPTQHILHMFGLLIFIFFFSLFLHFFTINFILNVYNNRLSSLVTGLLLPCILYHCIYNFNFFLYVFFHRYYCF